MVRGICLDPSVPPYPTNMTAVGATSGGGP